MLDSPALQPTAAHFFISPYGIGYPASDCQEMQSSLTSSARSESQQVKTTQYLDLRSPARHFPL